jgi:hypothetical protein
MYVLLVTIATADFFIYNDEEKHDDEEEEKERESHPLLEK